MTALLAFGRKGRNLLRGFLLTGVDKDDNIFDDG